MKATIRRTIAATAGLFLAATALTACSLTGISQLVAAETHACALLTDATVVCWGANTYGQIGDGTTTDRAYPEPVLGLTDVVWVSAGAFHTCATTSDGSVHCWGRNHHGQLGDGTTTDRPTAAAVTGITTAERVDAGGLHSCAVLDDGTARCWGRNNSGQIGDGTTSGPATTSRAVSGLTDAVDVQLGSNTSCAHRSDGSVACWGANPYGQLGDGTTTGRSTPGLVPGLTGTTNFTMGHGHACVVLPDTSVLCWGRNDRGQLGDGTTTYRYTPTVVPGLTDVASIVSGAGYQTCAVLNGGGARCWGANSTGEVGDGTTTDQLVPAAVVGLTDAEAVAPGGTFSCATRATTDQIATCWGDNARGQLGDGTLVSTLVPTTTVEAKP